MLDSTLLDPKYWRQRAEETRSKAKRIRRDDPRKQQFLHVADEYERVAERQEQWERSPVD